MSGSRINRLGRIIISACVLAIVVAPIADAKPRKAPKAPPKVERNVSLDYSSPGGAFVVSVDATVCLPVEACLTLGVEPGEKYMDIEVVDKSGMAVPFGVTFRGSGQNFCGSVDDLYLNGAQEVELEVQVTNVPNCPGPGTTGTINATLSNLP